MSLGAAASTATEATSCPLTWNSAPSRYWVRGCPAVTSTARTPTCAGVVIGQWRRRAEVTVEGTRPAIVVQGIEQAISSPYRTAWRPMASRCGHMADDHARCGRDVTTGPGQLRDGSTAEGLLFQFHRRGVHPARPYSRACNREAPVHRRMLSRWQVGTIRPAPSTNHRSQLALGPTRCPAACSRGVIDVQPDRCAPTRRSDRRSARCRGSPGGRRTVWYALLRVRIRPRSCRRPLTRSVMA